MQDGVFDGGEDEADVGRVGRLCEAGGSQFLLRRVSWKVFGLRDPLTGGINSDARD